MLVGLPGSGKSTWAREFVATHPRYRIVSTDAIRALLYGDEAIQGDWRQVWQGVMTEWRRGLGDMAQGTIDGIIYDATNAQRRQRRQVIATARGLGFARSLSTGLMCPYRWRSPATSSDHAKCPAP